MSEISCCMNCDMFRVFDGQCAITNTYIDDYLDRSAPNCPLVKTVSIGTKKQSIASIGLMPWGEQKMHIIQYIQGRTFIVKMQGENK